MNRLITALLCGILISLAIPAARAQDKLLNVSYDPTREFYADYNKRFEAFWKTKTGRDVAVEQSHGGSAHRPGGHCGTARRHRNVVVPADIAAIQAAGLIQPGWQTKLPFDSSPYTSTIVFVVRRATEANYGLAGSCRAGVQVVTPNPKTGGGARWIYLAAWGYALKKYRTETGRSGLCDQALSQCHRSRQRHAGSPIPLSSVIRAMSTGMGKRSLLDRNKLGAGKYQVSRPPSASSPKRRSRW